MAQLQTPAPAGGVGPGNLIVRQAQPDIRLPGLPTVREIAGLAEVQLQMSDAINRFNQPKLGGGRPVAVPDFSQPPGTARSDP